MYDSTMNRLPYQIDPPPPYRIIARNQQGKRKTIPTPSPPPTQYIIPLRKHIISISPEHSI
ncbi:hypothetical protein B9Z19DRAFT_1093555 [Tuber borchii]|uniref:Uncharacterized protein n=1 Tax=Tuber borchii TaxID=42251 RepID=A0A2T6ZFB2_TUBBO|nr:hypothetical protein B9Z19DRAFT_1093555 [Tuber borchii]